MRTNQGTQKVEVLKTELNKIRHESLRATRENDYRKIAQLTKQAAELNKALREVVAVD